MTLGFFPKETWLAKFYWDWTAGTVNVSVFLEVCKCACKYRWAFLFRKKPWRNEASIVSPICPSKTWWQTQRLSHSHFLGWHLIGFPDYQAESRVFTGSTFLGRWFSLLAAKMIEAPVFSVCSPCPRKGLAWVKFPSLLPCSLGRNTITTKTNFLFALIKMPIPGIW